VLILGIRLERAIALIPVLNQPKAHNWLDPSWY